MLEFVPTNSQQWIFECQNHEEESSGGVKVVAFTVAHPDSEWQNGSTAKHGVIRINRFSHCLAGKEMQQEQQLSNKKRRHRFRIVLYVTLVAMYLLRNSASLSIVSTSKDITTFKAHNVLTYLGNSQGRKTL